MKIFITGVAGFLGSHLAKRMLDLGHEVIGNDNLIGGDLVNLGNKVEIFFITDMSIICLTVIILSAISAIKMFECCGYDNY